MNTSVRAMHAVVALVADTHGWLDDHLCPALSAEKVTHILHAGDVALGKKKASNRLDASSLIAALKKVASVDAVRGNTDDDESLEWMLTFETGAIRFFVHHGVKNEMHGLPDWKDDEAVLAALEPLAGVWRESGDIIVYGHSHQPRFVRHASGVAFINPGTAGGPTETRRFGKTFPRQCAVVHCGEGPADTAFKVIAIDLHTGEQRVWAAEGEQLPAAGEAEATDATTTGVGEAAAPPRAAQAPSAPPGPDAAPAAAPAASARVITRSKCARLPPGYCD